MCGGSSAGSPAAAAIVAELDAATALGSAHPGWFIDAMASGVARGALVGVRRVD